MRAVAVLSLALAFAGIGASVLPIPDEFGYACFGLAAILSVVAVGMAVRPAKPRSLRSKTGDAPALLPATGTSDAHFPRIESASDSLGHVAKRDMSDTLVADTAHVLRPGQQVTFEVQASDPNGDDLEVRPVLGMGYTPDVAIRDGLVTWNVRDEDIADPAELYIYVASQRSYHRRTTWDDLAVFVYRVLPSL